MKTEIIAKLEELLSKNAGEVANDVRALQKEYQKLWKAEFEAAKQSFIDEGGKAKEFVYEKSAEDNRVGELFETFNKLKKEEDNKLALEQQKNLLIRVDIIAKIKDLTQVSTNVGAAVKKLQELQTLWKETGAVSPHKYKEVQSDYSRAIEDFYYNLKIFRELQDHDLKKNLELKQELLGKIQSLLSLENIKETERLIKAYRNDWEEIGPVPNDKWEALKLEFRKALEDVYAKIKSHYHAIEEKKENNLNAKKELIEQAKVFLAETEQKNGIDKWNDLTNKLIGLQNQWKTVGRTTLKDNDAVWAEFRGICDAFFEKKKAFFNVVHEKQGEVKKLKMGFIEKAEAMQNSTDWQKTSQDLMRLQDDWKKHILVNDREEGKLFFRFRKACNTFFDAKKAHFDGINAANEGNVAVKEEILARLNAFTYGDDISGAISRLKQFASEWNTAGQVPVKEKKRLNDAFYTKLDEYFDKLNMNKAEKAQLQFKSKIERLAASENASELLRREADHLKKQIDEINNSIRLYENNLGFFKNAKSDNPLLKEVNQKIEVEKQKIAEISAKRKLVTEELNKLREGSSASPKEVTA
ncbi:MAG: DUF349 domain-containing protein [Bacteroidia bacterium]